jgi:ATP-dependent protease HslVU (ClpYQ) peptidase subunit
MTTIVYCHKTRTMNADKQITTNGVRTSATKLHQHNQEVIGISGDMGKAAQLLHWYKQGANPDTFPAGDEACMLVASATEVKYFHTYGVPRVVTDFPVTIGSGDHLALMAMKCGLSAVDAIKMVSTLDVFTGAEVDTIAVPS